MSLTESPPHTAHLFMPSNTACHHTSAEAAEAVHHAHTSDPQDTLSEVEVEVDHHILLVQEALVLVGAEEAY